jgi:ABC-type phosphate/phosphonate transport system substrate-binding protein
MLRWLLLSLLFLAAHGAAASDNSLLLGVNEGSSGSADFQQRQSKYKPFADYISAVVKKQVKLESAQDLKSLKKNLQSGHFDLLMVRPSHISAAAMRDQKYVLVAAVKGTAFTSFIVHKDSALKKLPDLAGKSIAMPDENAYPTHVGLAMLKEAGLKPETQNVRFFRTQEAVGYSVEQKLVDVGVVISYSNVAKEWEGKGHRVLLKSKPLPYWSIVASPNLSPETVSKVREALLKLGDTPEGEAALKSMGVSGFVAGNPQEYIDLLAYLKE